MFRPREEIDDIEIWICPDQGICININRENEGYFFYSLTVEEFMQIAEFVEEGC